MCKLWSAHWVEVRGRPMLSSKRTKHEGDCCSESLGEDFSRQFGVINVAGAVITSKSGGMHPTGRDEDEVILQQNPFEMWDSDDEESVVDV